MSQFEVPGPLYSILSNLGPSGQFLRVSVSITLDEAPWSGGDALAEDIIALVAAVPDTTTPFVSKSTVEHVTFPEVP